MSTSRRDPRKAKIRRERIRREKRATSAGPPPDFASEHPFAAERALRDIHALLEGERFESADQLNARLEELTSGGRTAEMAKAWKQDDPKWLAQQLAYDALETEDPIEALRLVHEAHELDPHCTDANRLMVGLLPTSLENRLKLMREVVEDAERDLGEAFFEENAGHFWGLTETRPYMRAKQHLGELLVQAGQLPEAIAVFERMLHLNPGDNQGMRYPLLGLYLAENRPADAARLLAEYGEEDVTASAAWGRVLERWLSGKPDEAEAALAHARKVNPLAERYLSGSRKLPAQMPEYYQTGSEAEAQICARELAPACERQPAFRQWLRERR